ncbi:NUDIX hydrolase [Luteolibacter arcticus]|uniref:GDP-mannose pyrophosphatase n=1 Tax=Luteolibacter arcticus TaxID=1581411 RepID=A0ABT3GMD5_9BACT|nr:NUDIX hydrolase [Luteolibacter arcticus]MCW1924676.1 NUDIX hydrolase [Luteolibacter arcticus]
MTEPETLFETRWLGLYRIGHWDFAKRPNADAAVGILAVTPDDEVVLIEQFRIPVQRKVIEIPAGLVGDEDEFRGEDLAATAGRELLEETGYRAGKIELLLASPTSAGMTSELSHLFFATDLVKEHDGGGTEHEDIKVHLVPRRELRAWLKEKEAAGYLLDFKIHAALWAAGI